MYNRLAMPKSPTVDVTLDVSPLPSSTVESEPDSPFHILLIGDFSGRASRGLVEPLLGRRPIFIDRDEIDNVIRALDVQLQLPLRDEKAAAVLEIKTLDDFHPDCIYATQPLFSALRQRRAQLNQNAGAGPEPGRERPPEAPSSFVNGSLLDAIAATADAVPLPRKEELVRIEERIAREMRELLHHPLFQSLESAWRALDWLVRHTDTNHLLKLYILDASKVEILADLATASDLRTTGLYRILVAHPVQDEPWALIGADLYFRPWIDEVELLARLAMIADRAGAPLLAGADPSIVGLKSFDDTAETVSNLGEPNAVWQEARQAPEACRIGLALPRFLVRSPYGQGSSPLDSFAYERMLAATHLNYLWANPMYACVQLIARAFAIDRWEMHPGRLCELEDLSMHTCTEGGDFEIKSGAEFLLDPEAAERITAAGLMPLLTTKDSGSVRIGIFQSIADPPAPLEGRWL